MRLAGRLNSSGNQIHPATRAAIQATPRVIAQLHGISDGPAGTAETLRYMRNAARAAVRSPTQQVRAQALAIVKGLPPRAYRAEAAALHRFVRDHIRYVRDPVDVELVQTPEKTLEIGQGDCDDKSSLLAALLDSTGHEARFIAVGLNGDTFSHVLVETKIGDQWVPLETILPVEMGWFPAGVTSRLYLKM